MARLAAALSVAVLTGGRSRRMGTDKALLDWHGRPLLQHVLETLRPLSDDLLVVGDRPAYHAFGARVVADAWDDAGTLGGIGTALRAARHERVLVVACDMPFVSRELAQAMADEPLAYDALVPRTAGGRGGQRGDATWQVLHAIYTRACLAPIARRLDAGELKVVSFFEDVRVRALDEDWLRAYDPDLRAFANANTLDEYAAALRGVDPGQVTEDRGG